MIYQICDQVLLEETDEATQKVRQNVTRGEMKDQVDGTASGQKAQETK